LLSPGIFNYHFHHFFKDFTMATTTAIHETITPQSADLTRQIATAIAVAVTLVCNTLANTLPLNNRTTGAISATFDVYFVPAGYVFSIWSVIYLGLIAFVVYQFRPAGRTSQVLRAISPWFLLSCAMNSLWIFLWHYGYYYLTILVMLLLLVSLIQVYTGLEESHKHSYDTTGKTFLSPWWWCVQVPFSLYLGWICVATIANATAVLDYAAWDGWGISEETWTLIMLTVGIALGVFFTETRHDAIIPAVFVWAFAGIAVRHAATPIVAQFATVAAVICGVLVVRAFALERFRVSETTPVHR
jgi:translocator protein